MVRMNRIFWFTFFVFDQSISMLQSQNVLINTTENKVDWNICKGKTKAKIMLMFLIWWQVGQNGIVDWGGSRGRVRGVRTPSWDETFVFIHTYSLLIFFYLTVSDVILRGAPPPKKNPGSAPGWWDQDSREMSLEFLCACPVGWICF